MYKAETLSSFIAEYTDAECFDADADEVKMLMKMLK
jgi:hypothetical protein